MSTSFCTTARVNCFEKLLLHVKREDYIIIYNNTITEGINNKYTDLYGRGRV